MVRVKAVNPQDAEPGLTISARGYKWLVQAVDHVQWSWGTELVLDVQRTKRDGIVITKRFHFMNPTDNEPLRERTYARGNR